MIYLFAAVLALAVCILMSTPGTAREERDEAALRHDLEH
jgi:hypothetical protein